MAIDSREKRASLVGIIPVMTVGITPNAAKDQEWRQEVGWGYPGILATGSIETSEAGPWYKVARTRLIR